MYESRVKTLELEISNNQDQLRLLTARSEELEGLNYDLSSKNKSLSKYEKEYENLHRADNELQDRLRVCHVFRLRIIKSTICLLQKRTNTHIRTLK